MLDEAPGRPRHDHGSTDPWLVLDTSTGSAIVALGGEHDLADASRLESTLQEAAETGLPIIVDLEACSFIDSSIIAAIIHATHKRASDAFTIYVPPTTAPAVLRTLEILQIGQVVSIRETLHGPSATGA